MDRPAATPPAWNSETDGMLTLEVFRDGLIAILVILFLRYIYNRYSTVKHQDTKDPQDDLDITLNQYYPTPPSPLIRQRCNTHLKAALSAMKKYGVHPKRGFLPPRDPCQKLTNSQCEEWEWIGTQLPDLLSAGQCRKILTTMKLIDWKCIGKSRAQRRRAFLLLSAMANAYLWCEPDNIVDILPSNIAIPLCGVAKALGIQPALVHASIVLANWRRLDPKGPITTDNITTLIDILGGRDEKWFFLLTVEIEFVGAPALLPCLLLQSASKSICDLIATENELPNKTNEIQNEISTWIEYVITLLNRIQKSIDNMTLSFKKMNQQCDPYIFYHRVRPFLSGTKGNPTLPNGVIYEGVFDNAHQQCSGGSAAQSTLLPIFDAALGVNHNSEKFIKEMREYMPSEHRNFILHVQQNQASDSNKESNTESNKESNTESNKEFNTESNNGITRVLEMLQSKDVVDHKNLEQIKNQLIDKYNDCVKSLTSFRNVHMEMVKVYIIAEQRKAAMATAKANGEKSLGDAAGGKGTGGTGIMSFLKPMRNRTRECGVWRVGSTKSRHLHSPSQQKVVQVQETEDIANGIRRSSFIGRSITKRITFPSGAICHLIGSRGATIIQIQQESHCRINVQNANAESQRTGLQTVTLIGSAHAIGVAEMLLQQRYEATKHEQRS